LIKTKSESSGYRHGSAKTEDRYPMAHLLEKMWRIVVTGYKAWTATSAKQGGRCRFHLSGQDGRDRKEGNPKLIERNNNKRR